MKTNIKEPNDAALISLYLKGDENCLSILINRHQQRIFGFILSKTNDKSLANDLFQDTFIKIINTLKRGLYNEQGKFLPWALRIAHNLTMDYYRSAKWKNTKRTSGNFDVFDFLGAEDENIEEQMIHNQTIEKIIALITTLPRDQQEVIKMRIYYNLSFKEIAEQTGVSINTSLGRMRYALMNLRKMAAEQKISVS